jgi:hypothetical protein
MKCADCSNGEVFAGDKPVITIEIRDPVSDALTDPTTLAFTIRKPNDTEAAQVAWPTVGTPIARASVGVFKVETVALTDVGTHELLFVATMPSGGQASQKVVQPVSRF